MRSNVRVLTVSTLVLATGLGFLVLLCGSRADEEKGLRSAIDKMAASATQNPTAMQKEAEVFIKTHDSLEEVMNLFKKRTKEGKGGWGIGATATGQSDDGIEVRVQNLSRRAPSADVLAKDADALVQMSYRIAVIGEIAMVKAPTKKEADKDPKDWKEFATDMVKESLALAKACAAKDPKSVKQAASKLNECCSNCHGKFRD